MALYSRIKNWSAGDTLTADDLNTEFDNILTNSTPAKVDDLSADTTAARATTTPGTYASPTKATSMEGEIQQLRFILAKIIGGTNTSHLDDVPTNLNVLSDPGASLAIGLEFEGRGAGAASTTDRFAKLINQGAIINALSLSSADVAVADFDTTNFKYGSGAYSSGAGNILAFPATMCDPYQGTLSMWVRAIAANDYLAYNPLTGMELLIDSAGGNLIARVTEAASSSETAKATTSIDADGVTDLTTTAATTFRNVCMRWNLNDTGGASTDYLKLSVEGASEGTQISTDDIDINPGDGGVWFFGAKKNDPSWDHSYVASGLPNAMTDSWTLAGTAGTVSGGVLNQAPSGAQSLYTNDSPTVDLTQQTVEWKARLNSVGQRTDAEEDHGFNVSVLDDSLNRCIRMTMLEGTLMVCKEGAGTAIHVADIELDTSQYHVYRFTSSGTPSPTVKLYIDGVLVLSYADDESDVTGTDHIRFGMIDGSGSMNADLEYFKSFVGAVAPPVAVNSTSQFDSIGVANSGVTDNTVTLLQSSKVSDVFNKSPSYGPTLPHNVVINKAATISVVATNFAALPNADQLWYVPGDGVSEFLFISNMSVLLGGSEEFQNAIDINGDIVGQATTFASGAGYAVADSGNAGEIEAATTATRNVILPVGLQTIRFVAHTAGGNSAVVEPSKMHFERAIAKDRRLP